VAAVGADWVAVAVALADAVGDADLVAPVFAACRPQALIRTSTSSAEA
jgi:hypothetical protein